MVKELITRADAIIAEVRGETGGGSNAKISKSKITLEKIPWKKEPRWNYLGFF